MNDAYAAWSLSRDRFVASISDLNTEQLNYRLFPGTLTIGEMAVHIAGVDIYFSNGMLGGGLPPDLARLLRAAMDSVANDRPFPFAPEELTPEFVAETLATARTFVEPLIQNPTAEARAAEIVSVLGPVISGSGALARFAFHAAYHHGQVYLIRACPSFPA